MKQKKTKRGFAVLQLALAINAIMMGIIAGTAKADDVSRVVLFGGSSVATTYLPEATKHHNVLATQLKAAYPKQKIEVENWADNGEFIARYLLKGAYEKQRKDQEGIDVAIIRFGTNDQKRMKVPEYHEHMLKFIELLKTDFPGIAIILETGIYVDYPRHYTSDRNKTLDPYWEVSRKISAQFGYPLVDYYAATKQETEAGNWDLRIRTQAGKRVILDASEDAGKESDPKWFTDIHPNPIGVEVAMREEVRVLQTLFPEKLPHGQTAMKRESHDAAFYSKYLNFDAERLVTKAKNNPEKTLQEATK